MNIQGGPIKRNIYTVSRVSAFLGPPCIHLLYINKMSCDETQSFTMVLIQCMYSCFVDCFRCSFSSPTPAAALSIILLCFGLEDHKQPFQNSNKRHTPVTVSVSVFDTSKSATLLPLCTKCNKYCRIARNS